MANLTKTEKYVALTYAKYFGKTATKGIIDDYVSIGKTSKILKQIIKDADIEQYKVHGNDLQAEVHNTFQNLFSRNADNKELQKYVKVLEKGKNLPINSIVKKATKFDKDVYNNKQEIAKFVAEKGGSELSFDLSKVTKDNLIDVSTLTSLDDLQAKIDALPENSDVPAYILTASTDTFVGTDKGYVFKSDSFLTSNGNYIPTLNSSDELDGGAGKDVLNITDDAAGGYTMANATIKNIETITIKGAAAVTADVSGSNITGLETISVLKSAAATVTAAATTDVNVSGATGAITTTGAKNVDIKAAGNTVISKEAAGTVKVTDAGKAGTATSITVENGTDVTVNATTDTTGTIKVGDTAAKAAAKAATGNVEINSTFTTVAATDDVANAISVDGGKTITVNQMVTSSDTVLANTTGQTITQGNVVITGQDTTTTVTVKQEKSTAKNAAVVAVAEKLSTSTVTFKGMASGDSVTVNGLTFTASKALTAAEVAAAFANLEIGDTQVNSGPTANGIFTGSNDNAAIWTSGAVTNVDATTSTVTYSANIAGTPGAQLVTAKTGGATAPVASTATAGVLALDAEAGVTGIINGTVTITDGGIDSIKTISVDGYATSTITANVLETLTLANSGGATAGAIDAGMTVTTASTGSLTLNLDNVNGNVSLDGGGATLTGLNINTTGEDSKFALTAAKVETLTIAAAADLNVSGSTLSALKTATITGAGDVTLGDISTALATLAASAATGAISATVAGDKATVTTGSGDDVIVVTGTKVEKEVTLGAGDDKLDLSALTTVDANTAAISGGTDTDTVILDAAKADETAGLSQLANSIIFKSKVTGFEKLEISAPATAGTVNVGNLGYNHVIVGNSAVALTLKDMANNGTLELTGDLTVNDLTVSMKDATGTADTFNIVAKVNATDIASTNDVVVAGVETINITATDISPVDKDGLPTIDLNVLNLKANVAETITVTGNSHLELDLDSTVSTAVKLIDASTMKGDLTVTAYNAGMTVKGGDGNDTLIVDGSITGVVLTGGAGTDTFDVSAFDANANALSAVTITDLTAGETIVFNGSGSEKFVSSKVTLLSEATFSEYATEAAKVADAAGTGNANIAWFQFNNNTFVVQDVDKTGTFSATDIIVKINGVKDLSTASFNATDGTLEIA